MKHNSHVRSLAMLLVLSVAASAGPASAQQTASGPKTASGPASVETVRGVIRAAREVTLAADIAARVKSAPLRDGDSFKQGDVLIAFDCAHLEASLDAAKAAWRGHRNTWASNIKLRRYGAGGQFAVRAAKADMDKAEAEIRVLQARMQPCTIRAPFSGRVVEKLVSAHEMPGANKPLLRIVDDSQPEIQLVLPSRWLVWLKAGLEFPFHVDETGKSYPARIVRLGAVVDPVSQTIRVRARFGSRPAEVLSGMSGTARFSPARAMAARR